MKAQELAVVACRVGAVVLLVRGVLQFILSPFLFQGSFELDMLIQWLSVIFIPVTLLGVLAGLLWRYAERLGHAVVSQKYSEATLPGISAQSLTAAAISVTGIAVVAGVIPRIAQSLTFIGFVNLDPSYMLMRTDSISQLIGAFAGLAVGVALFFGGSSLSKLLTVKKQVEMED